MPYSSDHVLQRVTSRQGLLLILDTGSTSQNQPKIIKFSSLELKSAIEVQAGLHLKHERLNALI